MVLGAPVGTLLVVPLDAILLSIRSTRLSEVLAEAVVASVHERRPRDPDDREGLVLESSAKGSVQVSWAFVHRLSDAVQALQEVCHAR